jgi:hypothetical protein
MENNHSEFQALRTRCYDTSQWQFVSYSFKLVILMDYVSNMLNKYCVVVFDQNYNIGRILANRWKEDKKFLNMSTSRYPTTSLWETYMYLMILLCRLYREKDCSRFIKAWILLVYTIVMHGKSFN